MTSNYTTSQAILEETTNKTSDILEYVNAMPANPPGPIISWKDYQLYKIGLPAFTVFSAFLVVTGNVGNILSFIIMSKKSFSDSTTSIYFRVLAGWFPS